MLSFVKRHRIIVASVIFCLLSLHLASNVKKGTGGEAIVRYSLSLAARPIQITLASVRSRVKGMWEGYIYLVGIKEENEALNKKNYALLEENNRLKEEVGLNEVVLRYRGRELKAFFNLFSATSCNKRLNPL